MYGNVTFRSLALDSWTLTFGAGTVRQRGQITHPLSVRRVDLCTKRHNHSLHCYQLHNASRPIDLLSAFKR